MTDNDSIGHQYRRTIVIIMVKISKRISELQEYQDTRKCPSNDEFLITITCNLLTNLALRNNFIHSGLRSYKSQRKEIDDNLRILSGLYVCSLVTCWETFFRDLFVFLCNNDKQIEKYLMSLKQNEIIPQGITLGEFYTTKYNFQNLEELRLAFDGIFHKNTQSISDYFSDDIFHGVIASGHARIYKWIHDGVLNSRIETTLHKAFRIRHRVTHDANYLVDIDSELFSDIECVFQMVPQFFISHIAGKYVQKRVVFNVDKNGFRITDSPENNEVPYAFTIDDFMATDYEVVDY